MELAVVKVITMVLTGFIPILLGLLPLCFKSYILASSKKQTTLGCSAILTSILLCFGGGVLLCTSMVHILPEVRENLASLDVETEALAEIMVCCGFFLIYFVEEIVHTCIGSQLNEVEPASHSATLTSISAPLSAHGRINLESSCSLTSIRDFFFVMALSMHAVFEGLAVGLEGDEEGVWILFTAVCTHKFVMAFCMGVELVSAGTPVTPYMIYICIFAFMSPIGIAIGLTLSELATDSITFSATTGILQALSAGCIIYVVVFEILQRERSKNIQPKIVQFLALVVGFCTMMTIDILTAHDHGHGGHEEHGEHGITALVNQTLNNITEVETGGHDGHDH